MVVAMGVAMGVVGLIGFPVECSSWDSLPGSLHPLMGHGLAGSRGLLGSLFILTSSEHSLLGNEMQIDRKDNEPACGRWGSF